MISKQHRLMALACACATLVAPAAAQEHAAIKQGFDLPANSAKTILVFRPAVSVGSQSTGGSFEPNSEWTEAAKANIQSALESFQAKLGNTVIVAPEAYGDAARSVQEHIALFGAVARAVTEYQFFKGNRLPTKKRDNKADVFDWSLGSGVAALPGAQHADYGLFIYNKDAYGSTGRKVLQALALLGPRIAITSGVHEGYAGLVDLKTGDLLWLNADQSMGGNVRDAEGAKKRVRELLEDIPGGRVTATPPSTATP